MATRSYDSPAAGAARPLAPRLIRAFQCHRPLAPPAIVELAGHAGVCLGRGDRPPAPTIEDGALVVRLETDDEWMSTRHATVRTAAGAWVVIDHGSKNGTFVNGERVEQDREASLSDGDRIRAGESLFVFRADGGDSIVPAPILSTHHGGLAASLMTLQQVAPTAVSIVLLGESGTGKEVVARAIHRLSERTGPFVAVNCGAVPATLIESELFGFRRGAFSGADRDSPGLVRAADGGTLFLDEVAELSESTQVALLRILQEREVVPIGATTPVPVDLRIIAATHQDLERRVADGRFRGDLFARLVGLIVRIPPLRDRVEDLGLLIAALLPELVPEQSNELRFSLDAAVALFDHSWPRNVRELRSVLEVAAAIAGDEIRREHLQLPCDPVAGVDRRRQALIESLRANAGNVSRAARSLGYSRAHFHRLMKLFGVEPSSFRT